MSNQNLNLLWKIIYKCYSADCSYTGLHSPAWGVDRVHSIGPQAMCWALSWAWRRVRAGSPGLWEGTEDEPCCHSGVGSSLSVTVWFQLS